MSRKNDVEALGFLCLIVLALCVAAGTWVWARNSHDNQIREWAYEHNYTVQSIERIGVFGNDSPFYRRKNDDLCRAILLDHDHQPRTSFFRWHFWWGMDQAWKED